MYLLPNEQELVNSNEDKILLTDHRIHYTHRIWGKSYQNTLFLEDISSVENLYQSNMLYLVLAILSVFAGIFSMGNDHLANIMVGCIILAAVFFILWLGSRKHVVSISPNGGKPIVFEVEGMGGEQIEDFLFKVQKAKSDRINTMYKLLM